MGRSKRIKSISQPSIPSNPTLTQEQLQILRHAASIPNIPVSDLLSILKSFGASAPSSGLSSRPSPTEGSQHILGQIMDVNSCGLSSVSMNPPLSDPHNPLQDFNTIPGQVNGRNFDFTWLENAEIEDISSFWTENILPQISQLPNENFTDHQTPLLPSNYLSSPNSSQENAFTALHSHTGYLPESSLVPHTHHSRPDNDSQPQMYSSAEMCANDFYFAASQTQVGVVCRSCLFYFLTPVLAFCFCLSLLPPARTSSKPPTIHTYEAHSNTPFSHKRALKT